MSESTLASKSLKSESGSYHTFVIVNPASATCATRKQWPMIEKKLRLTLGAYEFAITEAPGHATELAREALAKGFEMVVAVGGDGTFHEVACGFFDGDRPIGSNPVLGIISHGTGCDLPRTLFPRQSLSEMCRNLSGRKTRHIDVGHVTYTDHQGKQNARVFLNVLSFGCGGAVSAAAKNMRLGGKLGFQLTTAKVLLRYRDQKVDILYDQARRETLSVTNFAVCNARFFGGGMQVSPEAIPDDGCFDLTIWQGLGIKDFLMRRSTLYNGLHVDYPETQVGKAREISATSSEKVLLDVDGENPGTLPISVKILPAALRIKI